MSEMCKICGARTIFFVWSSSRYFNRKKLWKSMATEKQSLKREVLKDCYTVCIPCVRKYELMEK